MSAKAKTAKVDAFAQPVPVRDLDLAFGGDMKALLPAMADIPAEFSNMSEKWNKVVSTWFYSGLKGAVFVPKAGIDKAVALRHVGAVMGSYAPKHEHKMAGCAYLLSKWFVRVDIPGGGS